MLTDGYALSLAAGDLLLLEGRWYITHAGLLRFAQRGQQHCGKNRNDGDDNQQFN